MNCVYVPVFTIRLDLALCIFCIDFVFLGLSLCFFVLSYLLSLLSCLVNVRNTKLCLGTPSLVVYVFAAGPIMFPMGAVALGSICWPEVVLWNWFQWW